MSFAYVIDGGFLACSIEQTTGVFKAPAGVDVSEYVRSFDRIKYIYIPLKGEGKWKRVGCGATALNYWEAATNRSSDQTSPEKSDVWWSEDNEGYPCQVRFQRELYTCPWTGKSWYWEKTVF